MEAHVQWGDRTVSGLTRNADTTPAYTSAPRGQDREKPEEYSDSVGCLLSYFFILQRPLALRQAGSGYIHDECVRGGRGVLLYTVLSKRFFRLTPVCFRRILLFLYNLMNKRLIFRILLSIF